LAFIGWPAVSFFPPFPFSFTGWDFIRDLIWEDITMNAFSTFVAFFAEVSTNSMPKELANSF
jgi:hypothetical protein